MFLHRIIQLLLKSPKFWGRDFLIEKLPKWFLRKPKGTTVVKTHFGFKIELNPSIDLNIENVIYQRGVYEQATTEFIQEYLKKGSTFVDAGANIGYLSLVAASVVCEKGNVYAFEPVKSTFDLLQRNAELNQFTQIKCKQFGLGSQSEEVVIYSENQNRGGASIVNRRSEQKETIQICPLDAILSEEKVDLLKIDVEGYEFEVLKGAEQIIRKDHPAIIIEYSQQRNNAGANNEMIDWLSGVYEGYKFFRFEKGKERSSKLVNCKFKHIGFPEHDNIICLPKKSL